MKSVFWLLIVTIAGFNQAFADRGSGGSSKPAADFGYENIGAILQSKGVAKLLGFNLEIVGLKLRTQKGAVRTYRIVADDITRSGKCVFDVDVFNDHPTLIKDVKVSRPRIIKGCITASAPEHVSQDQGTKILAASPAPGKISLAEYKRQMAALFSNEEALFADTVAAAASVDSTQLKAHLAAYDALLIGKIRDVVPLLRVALKANPKMTNSDAFDITGDKLGLTPMAPSTISILGLMPLVFADTPESTEK